MFRIENNTIHCSRGDSGTIKLTIPIVDRKNYIKYTDGNTPENIYWYDIENQKLYDSDYIESSVSIKTLTMVVYEFQPGDVIEFKAYEKNGYNKPPLTTVTVTVDAASIHVDIPLTKADTTFAKIENKETVYWYDVTLNDDSTVVCYNENGAKEMIIYPAKGDVNNARNRK